jgi:protein SCO1
MTIRACSEARNSKRRSKFLLPPSDSRLAPRASRLFSLLFFAYCLLPVAFSSAHDDGRPIALRGVALEQRLGERLPLEREFRDETGRTVRLGDYFGKRPVILTLAYYDCQELCPLTLEGLLSALRALSFSAGKEFDVLAVSFDPKDTAALAAAKRDDAVARYGRSDAGAGWHFLTGVDASIHSLTEAAGFRFNEDERNGGFGHATGIMVVTPDGRLARYFYGVEFSPRDVRLGLIEAAAGKIGSPIDQLLLFCYHYDPATGKYGLLVMKLLRVAAVVTVLALAGFIIVMLRRDAQAKPQEWT